MILLVILGVIVVCFSGSYLLFKIIDRHSDPRKNRGFWILSWTSTIILSLASPYILLLAVLFQSGTSQRAFDSERWKIKEGRRTEMVDDLVGKKVLDKLTKEQVIHLLGDPLKDNPYFVSTGRDMIYHLGRERNPLGVDSEWLLIWLDDNKVTKYEIVTD
jgi:hypothetical protein